MKPDATDSIKFAPSSDEENAGGRQVATRGVPKFRRQHLLLPAILFAAAAIVYGALVPADDHQPVPQLGPRGGLIAAREHQPMRAIAPDGRLIAERLDDPDVPRRKAAFRAAIRKHDREVAALVDLATRAEEQDEYFETRELAVELLAHYGTREAIPIYVRSIEYFAAGFVTEYSPLNGYPCALALRRIGLSAQPEVFMFLQTTGVDEVSDKAIDLYADLMLSIYHSNNGGHVEAVEVVRRAMERASRRGNLRRVLEKLEKTTKDWPVVSPPAHPTE